MISGLPKTITISSNDVTEALQKDLQGIVEAVKDVLHRTPPELSADVIDKGIVMSGGSSLLRNIDQLMSRAVGVPVYVADESLLCVARGTGIALDNLELYKTFDWRRNKIMIIGTRLSLNKKIKWRGVVFLSFDTELKNRSKIVIFYIPMKPCADGLEKNENLLKNIELAVTKILTLGRLSLEMISVSDRMFIRPAHIFAIFKAKKKTVVTIHDIGFEHFPPTQLVGQKFITNFQLKS